VQSSSLEVLAALALNDEDHAQHMPVKDPQNIPAFYKAYVEEIQHRIVENAALEFDCIWNENEKSNTPRTLLTDKLSDKINTLNDLIQASALYDNKQLRDRVLSEAIPKRLLELLGLEKITSRVPVAYTKAVFGSYLASRFVYKYGINSSDLAFFEYMQGYLVPPTTT
jgi:glutamate dehydrogenase